MDNRKKRILIVEDDKNIADIVDYNICKQGYETDTAYDGEKGLALALSGQYDLILLDVMLPKMDGFELVRRLRSRGDNTPVLFLTARDAVADRVQGLESGGDYYLTKPFDFKELMAVVRVMARKYTGNRSNVYTIADLSLDSNTRTVTRAGKNIELTAKEFSLLEYMMRNKEVVLSREMIENNLWNYDYEGGTNVVDVYVGYLRKKMDTGFSKKLIHTVWGTGWVLKEK